MPLKKELYLPIATTVSKPEHRFLFTVVEVDGLLRQESLELSPSENNTPMFDDNIIVKQGLKNR